MMGSHMQDGFSYLDGISVKITSKFLPPRPVALPIAHDTIFSEDLLAEKYDFTFERKVLEAIHRRKAEITAKASKLHQKNKNSSNQNLVEKKPDHAVEQCIVTSWQTDSILLPKLQQSRDTVPVPNEPTTKINLSDFENDTSSPFDLMELKTINDLEELSSVFQGIGNNICTEMPVENSLENTGNVSKSVSFPLSQTSTYVSSDRIPNSWSENFSEGFSEFSSKGHESFSVHQSSESQERLQSRSQPSNVNQNVSSGSQSIPCSSSSAGQPPQLYTPAAKLDFVSNYSSSNPAESVSFSGAVSDFVPDRFCTLSQVPYIPSLKGSTLKTSKSYSDIQTLPDSEWITKEKKRCCTPPSSIGSGYDNNIFTEDPSVHIEENVNCDNNFPDPYDELGKDERALVDSITEMGFLQAQVARAVKHLGSDDKKVVEHLCHIQMLEESGYESLEAEAALHLHDYNHEQAKMFLDLVIQFQDLGFEKNAVKKALIQNKNDWNKTIDSLLPSQ